MPENLPLADLRIQINGADVPGDLASDVISVTVQEDLGALSMFSIDVHNWNQHTLQLSWSEHRSVVLGAEVKLWLGYVDRLTEVMTGEITSLEPAFHRGEPPRLTIRGLDHGHRLQRGHKTRSFAKLKDSEIARQLATDNGLSARVVDSKVKLDHVVQHNQTDWAFLSERADRIGYLVRIDGRTLHFGPPRLTGPTKATLRLSEEVRTFRARLANRLLDDRRRVTGWDVKRKQEIVGVAGAGKVSGLGPGTSGLGAGAKAYGAATVSDVSAGPSSPAEADLMAAGQLQAGSLQVISGEVECEGMPNLHAGDLVRIAEAGRHFSGTYLVAGVTHTTDQNRGYRTRLAVRRNTI